MEDHPSPRYIVIDLGTLPNGTEANDNAFAGAGSGAATGYVSLPGGAVHAVLWDKKSITDMGTLGGLNSSGFGLNERAQVSGYSETGSSDPNGEDFCGYGTHLICLGFLWQNDAMTPLPTLGGNNGSGLRINSRDEVAGYAENTTKDPSCPAPQVFEFKPVIWGANGDIHELPTFSGDAEGFAWGINGEGQAVGASGSCAGFGSDGFYLFESHALSWKDGKVTDLGNLGGIGGAGGLGNAAFAVNNRGDVVGHSDLPGDAVTHAFLWTRKTGMKDLGTLPGDTFSFGEDINDAGEIVGISMPVEFSGLKAVLWENGAPIDLNSLVVPGGNAGLHLEGAFSINCRGQITGQGTTSGGEMHAFLATRVDDDER
jgi:probable HAF family extracellular repeat protein